MGIPVGVIGYRGRMGREACAAIEADEDLELAARVGRGDSLDSLSGCAVAVDLTTPDAVAGNVRHLIDTGIHGVVGTSGLTPDDLGVLDEAARLRDVRVLVAPNFAVGAVVMMTLAAKAAPYFQSAEIVERHHARKVDAPSGTSLRTAQLMNAGRLIPWDAASGEGESIRGARGGDADGVRIHSLRMSGSVAHQEVILGGTGETLTIRHDSLDRASFMPGILLSVKRVASLPPGVTVGLEHLLDL
jgi:4-hydroxy-tetrahydrodipicolinate reductase